VDLQPWRYFISIEADFVETLNFVDLDPKNGSAFSNEYAKLLLLIGSEVDVIAKMICRGIPGQEAAHRINGYYKALTGAFPGIDTVEIDVERYPTALKPWEFWKPGLTQKFSPLWWDAYNLVKHRRDTNFHQANQANVLHALCGLFAFLLYFYQKEDNIVLQPAPRLLDFGFPEQLIAPSRRPKRLPGT
jgi:hypothetical protein